MNSDMVTTIIPVYNRSELLREAVDSVLGQIHRPIEIIIVDDGSTDDTSWVGRKYAQEYPKEIVYFRQENQGVAAARNTGIKFARGEFIQFLDSDDFLMPKKFKSQVSGLRENPQCGISYCYTREHRIEDEKKNIPARRTGETFDEMFPEVLFGRLWATSTPLFRKNIIDIIGYFNDYAIYEDWEYECRAAAMAVKLHHCKEFLVDKRGLKECLSAEGLTNQKLRDYAKVHELIYQYAKQANVGDHYLDKFSRTLFFIARRCAAAGYQGEARRMLNLATQASRKRINKIETTLYSLVSEIFGWKLIGKVFC